MKQNHKLIQRVLATLPLPAVLFCLLNLMFEIDFIENEDFVIVMFVCVRFVEEEESQNILKIDSFKRAY